MAAITKGEVFVYGIDGTVAGAIANTAWQSYNESQSFELTATVQNSQGQIITERFDDIKKELTVDFIPKSTATAIAMGDEITIDSIEFYVVSIDKKRDNKAFNVHSLKLMKREYVATA